MEKIQVTILAAKCMGLKVHMCVSNFAKSNDMENFIYGMTMDELKHLDKFLDKLCEFEYDEDIEDDAIMLSMSIDSVQDVLGKIIFDHGYSRLDAMSINKFISIYDAETVKQIQAEMCSPV